MAGVSDLLDAKVSRHSPMDYEKVLVSHKDDLKQEEFPNLLLFPQQDVTVKSESWDYRTAVSTVPDNALELPTTLFTKECLNFYCSQWERVTYNYGKYSGSYATLLDEEEREALPHLTFERDQLEAEQMHKEEVDIAQKPLSKSGYLYKGPFPDEQGGFSMSIKSYRKRWFDLKGGASYGGYTLIYYRDDKSSSRKGKVNLEMCTDIRKNSKYRSCGFDLITEDEKICFPLAAENERELEEWMDCLGKAIGIDTEEPVTPIKPLYSTDTLRDFTKQKHSLLRPDKLQYSEGETDKSNRQKRQSDRNDLFVLYPELLHQPPPEAEEGPGPVPREDLGVQVLVQCKRLSLKLTMSRSGKQELLEPFFIRLALFDAQKGLKISEDFHVDLNDHQVRALLQKQPSKKNQWTEEDLDEEEEEEKEGVENNGGIEQHVNEIKEAIFSVTFPHADIYLVARIEKVLNGTIQSSTEPYQKGGENTKMADKISKQMTSICSRLGEYGMPFAWTARPVFSSGGTIDSSSEFSPLFRQERERLTDDDLLKYLSDFKNIARLKLPIIPGSLVVSVEQFVGHTGLILNSSLFPLKKSTKTSSATPEIPVVKEIQEFPPLLSYEPHIHYDPHLSLTHNLFVYPLSLNYESQKQFTKARNISVCVQFKDIDTRNSKPLKVIYSRSVGESFTDKALSTVLYHCTTPTFYEEVKVKLPVRLNRRHHLLFTFLHISCDIPKQSKASKSSLKQEGVKSVVGYAWLPLLETDGRVIGDIQSLPVSTTLPPGYLSVLRGDLKKPDVPIPDIKWVDGAKLIFKTKLHLNSTIYTQDSELFTFFAVCDHVVRGKPVPVADLRFAIESVQDVDLVSLQYLPVVLNRLFHLVCSSQEIFQETKLTIIRVLIGLIEKVISVKRDDILKAYIEYIFVTEVDAVTSHAVHDELARLLVQYIKNQPREENRKFLNYVWFFLDVILKSMAQFLCQIGKETASRKNRYPEDFGWNLQSLISQLLPLIVESRVHPTGSRANIGLATFIKHSFSFMDRGVVFRIIDKYLEYFDNNDVELIVEMKLEFLSKVCEHEHFVPLNLPFKTKSADVIYTLSDEYCQKHYLAGMLLKELESSLGSNSTTMRQKAITLIRNLIAKLDSDERLSVPAQKSRIATLFFPLIPIIIKHSSKLNRKPKNESHTQHPQTNVVSEPVSPATPISISGNEETIHVSTGVKRSLVSEFSSGSLVDNVDSTDPVSSIKSKGNMSLSGSKLDAQTSLESPDLISITEGDDDEEEEVEKVEEEPVKMEGVYGYDETRDLLICFLFVLKHVEQRVIEHWWNRCIDTDLSTPRPRGYSWSGKLEERTAQEEKSELNSFFDVMEVCIHLFEYSGRLAITKKWSARATMLKQLEQTYTNPIVTKMGGTRKSFAMSLYSNRSRMSRAASSNSFLSPSQLYSPLGSEEEDMELYIRTEGSLANEVGLTVLETVEMFTDRFKAVLNDEDENPLISKVFTILTTLLQVNQSTEFQTHIFASLKSFIHKFTNVIFKGRSDYCGTLCYQILQCCNSTIASTRAEAVALLYLLMRCNFAFSNQKGFIRTDLQVTIALAKIATSDLPRSHSHLRRSLAAIVTYADNDSRVKTTTFPVEVRELMIRLRTVLTSTAQMKEHRIDPEKLLDLHYTLAKSYAHSPELRHTWLESMAQLHIQHKNYTEASQCYLHIAGLIAEFMKITGKYSGGCKTLRHLSRNIELEESGIKMDKGTGLERRYSEDEYIRILENAMSLLEDSQHYELTTQVFKLLLPYYEEERDYKKLMEMYGRLYESHKKIISFNETGKRYLGTYFRVAFYGQMFGEDNEKQYIYREPNITSLTEISQRLHKLISRKYGPEIVQVLQESGKINIDSLDPDKVYIQVTHVVPYFTTDELLDRPTKFERENSLSRFVFEVPFTPSGKAHGSVANQHMRKTILTTSHWFPYVVKRIPVIDQETFELSPIEVAIEAMERKRDDLVTEVEREKKDLVKLQLLLQGSISAQVNQGVQEYANVFLSESSQKYPHRFTDQLKDVYRSFMEVCEIALKLHGQLINVQQALLQQDMMSKYYQMKHQLTAILNPSQKRLVSSQSDLTFPHHSKLPQRPDLTRAITSVVIPNPSTL